MINLRNQGDYPITMKIKGALVPFASMGASAFTSTLGTAAKYALLGYSGITNVGPSVVTNGDIGAGTGSTAITGFPPGSVVPPAVIDQSDVGAAQTALAAAITVFETTATTATLSTADMGGQTVGGGGAGVYRTGVYVSASTISIATPITLDAQGNSAATFIFYATTALTQAAAGTITLINGAQPQNVVWVLGSSWTTVGPGAVTVGNILAHTSITLGGGYFNGRALANTGAVSISGQTQVAGLGTGTSTAPSAAQSANSYDYSAPLPFNCILKAVWAYEKAPGYGAGQDQVDLLYGPAGSAPTTLLNAGNYMFNFPSTATAGVPATGIIPITVGTAVAGTVSATLGGYGVGNFTTTVGNPPVFARGGILAIQVQSVSSTLAGSDLDVVVEVARSRQGYGWDPTETGTYGQDSDIF